MSNAETLVMALAVGIAEAEGNPLDISAVAAITRLPRTTVLRKLRQREKQGKLVRIRDGRRVLLAPSDRQKLSKQRQDFFDQIEEAVRRCREALAELDKVRPETPPIRRQYWLADISPAPGQSRLS